MGVTVEDYVDVAARFAAFGMQTPTKLALLPFNFASVENPGGLRQRAETSDIRTLFRNTSVPFEDIEGITSKLPIVQNNSIQWVAPIIFVSLSAWSQNASLLSVALSVIANYLTELFKGKPSAEVQLEVVIEKNKAGHFAKVSYSGPVDGLNAVAKIAKDAAS
jgi:hypothetical protein